MKCPNCHFENPADSRFCSKFATPLLPSQEISYTSTKTLQTPMKRLTRGGTLYLADLGHVYGVIGNRDEAFKLLEELLERSKQRHVPQFQIALIYVALGESDKAFEFLEKAYDERSGSINTLRIEPRLDSLREDPRFMKLLEKMGLE